MLEVQNLGFCFRLQPSRMHEGGNVGLGVSTQWNWGALSLIILLLAAVDASNHWHCKSENYWIDEV